MKISIAQRNRPFSHVPGTSCVLPRTCWTVQAYPAKIILRDRERQCSDGIIEIPLSLRGPVREFTVQQDLENGSVLVWGKSLEGLFHLRLRAVNGAIELKLERAPAAGIVCCGKTIHKHECFSWKIAGPCCERRTKERLSLGSHRLQDWEKVWRRFDFSEIFPILFQLSRWTPKNGLPSEMECRLNQGFEPFLRAAFYGMLCPRLMDDEFQGLIGNEAIDPQASPGSLILDAGDRIRSLFIQQKGMEISLLPDSDFRAGRMTEVELEQIGSIDFEWSQSAMRCAVLQAACDARILLKLKTANSFRLRRHLQDKGVQHLLNEELHLEAGNIYFLDRFQK